MHTVPVPPPCLLRSEDSFQEKSISNMGPSMVAQTVKQNKSIHTNDRAQGSSNNNVSSKAVDIKPIAGMEGECNGVPKYTRREKKRKQRKSKKAVSSARRSLLLTQRKQSLKRQKPDKKPVTVKVVLLENGQEVQTKILNFMSQKQSSSSKSSELNSTDSDVHTITNNFKLKGQIYCENKHNVGNFRGAI